MHYIHDNVNELPYLGRDVSVPRPLEAQDLFPELAPHLCGSPSAAQSRGLGLSADVLAQCHYDAFLSPQLSGLLVWKRSLLDLAVMCLEVVKC